MADGLRLDHFRLETCAGFAGFQSAVARLAAVSFHAADNGIRLQHGAVPYARGHSGLSSHGAVSGVLPAQTPWPDEASKGLTHITTTCNTHPRTMPRKGRQCNACQASRAHGWTWRGRGKQWHPEQPQHVCTTVHPKGTEAAGRTNLRNRHACCWSDVER